jgi:hypothetical protein
MKTPISQLLAKAAKALPPQKPSRSSWAPFAPVVTQLQANGYDLTAAVDWLIAEKQVELSDRLKCYRSLRQLLERQNPKTNK